MLEGVQAVIFDLDGTLIDSMGIWGQIDIDFLGRFDIKPPEDLHKIIEGMSFTETAIYFKDRFKLDLSIDEIKNAWNEMAQDYYLTRVPLKVGAHDLICNLHSKGIKLGIATSCSPELVRGIVNKFGLDKYFTSIRTSCEVAAGKPAPDIYLKVADDLGVNPKNCFVFEDVPLGIQAGLAAGMRVCAVYDEFSSKRMDEIKSLANYYIMDYNDIESGKYETLKQ